MAVPLVAARVGTLAAQYAPQIQAAAKDLLAKATNGKVSNLTDVAKYVGNSPERMSIAANSLVRAGFSVDDVLPLDIIGENTQLQAIRAGALKLVAQVQTQFANGSDKLLAHSAEHIAQDMLRARRVQVALSVYGSADRYALCHPNGGIPAEDFVWYKRVVQGVRG